MKKVIDGKVYDTETARLVGEYEYDIANNLNYLIERLFCKKTGEYFMYGEGGPRTPYAKRLGDDRWSSGVAIVPLTPDEARGWAEKHLDTDIALADGDKQQEAGRVTMNLTVAAQTKARLETAREETGLSISKLVDAIVAEWPGKIQGKKES